MYFDYSYFEIFMGTQNLSATLSYGNTPATVTGSVFAQYASGACSFVDSFLEPTYAVPIENPPETLKLISANVLKRDLLRRSHQEIPADLKASIDEGNGYLMMVREGRLTLPGVSEQQAGAVAGGFVVTDRSEGTFAPVFDRNSLRGTWD